MYLINKKPNNILLILMNENIYLITIKYRKARKHVTLLISIKKLNYLLLL